MALRVVVVTHRCLPHPYHATACHYASDDYVINPIQYPEGATRGHWSWAGH